MCFYNDDCDWTAEVHDESHVKCEGTQKCVDCRREIQSGEWVRRIFQMEHEECQICEDPDSDLYEDPDEIDEAEGMYGPGLHPHYFGEYWLGYVCRKCCLLRAAIYDLEEKEGCPSHAREPAFGELRDVMQDDVAKWGDRKYTNHSLQMFPELAQHAIVSP